MTGPIDSVIGMDKEGSVQRFLTGLPTRFEPASGPVKLNAVLIDVDETTGARPRDRAGHGYRGLGGRSDAALRRSTRRGTRLHLLQHQVVAVEAVDVFRGNQLMLHEDRRRRAAPVQNSLGKLEDLLSVALREVTDGPDQPRALARRSSCRPSAEAPWLATTQRPAAPASRTACRAPNAAGSLPAPMSVFPPCRSPRRVADRPPFTSPPLSGRDTASAGKSGRMSPDALQHAFQPRLGHRARRADLEQDDPVDLASPVLLGRSGRERGRRSFPPGSCPRRSTSRPDAECRWRSAGCRLRGIAKRPAAPRRRSSETRSRRSTFWRMRCSAFRTAALAFR